MQRQHWIRDLGPFVVTGHDEHRDPRVSDPLQRDERTLDEAGRHPATEEEISPVDNEVDCLLPRCLQDQFIVGKEIMTPAPSLDPGSLWQIESEMCVRKEQNPQQSDSGDHCPIGLIFMLRNRTSLPWSCRAIWPMVARPYSG